MLQGRVGHCALSTCCRCRLCQAALPCARHAGLHAQAAALDGPTAPLLPPAPAQVRIMDSNDLERERGITILSKVGGPALRVVHAAALVNPRCGALQRGGWEVGCKQITSGLLLNRTAGVPRHAEHGCALQGHQDQHH